MKKVFIFGINGKMGGALTACAANHGYTVVGGYDKSPNPAGIDVYNNAKSVNVPFDIIIDFSNPTLMDEVISLATIRKAPVVIATTGYDAAALEKIAELAKLVPVFRSGNMSLGIAAIKAAALTVKAILGDAFDIEIVEKHHNQKLDSPSGTALLLADALADKSAQTPNRAGKRRKGEVGITSVRGGGVVGEHEIGFYGADEIVTIAHSARSRNLFAAGAYKAADLLLASPSGLYDMDDLVKASVKQ